MRLHPDATNQSETGPMAIFQYMIGNTDWSIPNQHNVKMLQVRVLGQLLFHMILTGLVYCARIYLSNISLWSIWFTQCTIRFQTTVSVPDGETLLAVTNRADVTSQILRRLHRYRILPDTVHGDVKRFMRLWR